MSFYGTISIKIVLTNQTICRFMTLEKKNVKKNMKSLAPLNAKKFANLSNQLIPHRQKHFRFAENSKYEQFAFQNKSHLSSTRIYCFTPTMTLVKINIFHLVS